MNPMTIDMSPARRIASASTQLDGRDRWTEITVYHFAEGATGGKVWVSEVRALSDREGERTKTRRMASASLERAMCIIDESDLGLAVKETAREYAEDHGMPLRVPGRQVVPEDDRDALDWLFGTDDASLRSIARALDVGESTLRAQIAGNGVKVPIRALLPFIDRQAFQAAVQKEMFRG